MRNLLLALLAGAVFVYQQVVTYDTCPGVAIVENGLAAFAAGTPQIGTYTDAVSYHAGGVAYIRLMCGDAIADEFEVRHE